MGAIKTTELDNKNIGLEITYGGLEAPFGGIDSSMPPAYIDPKCQVEVDGFAIIDNQLVAVSLAQCKTTFSGLPTGAKLCGFGNFYTKANGYQNFMLAAGPTTTDGSTQVSTLTLYLYIWSPPLDYINDSVLVTPITLVVAQTANGAPATPATVDVIMTTNSGGGSGNSGVTLTLGATVENYSPLPASDTPAAMASLLAGVINGLPSAIVTAAVDSSGTSVTLTTIATGEAANETLISIQLNTPEGTYPVVNTGFQGGAPAIYNIGGVPPLPLSFVSEGENLYLGGPGTMILQYVDAVFSLLSQYVGANTLKKFGGSLVALGTTPLSALITSPEMVLAWSAASQFGVWNPTNSSGQVTGAGFEQLADIEDIITGGFVNSSTLVILRSKGISYATLTGNGTEPFDVNHVDLAPEGEGCQNQLLNSQYGPVGFYIGNSNVYSFVQQLAPIGDKIKTYLFEQLSVLGSDTDPLVATKAIAHYLLNTETVFYAIYASPLTGSPQALPYLYLYNNNNQTWTRISAPAIFGASDVYMENLPLIGISNTWKKQSQLILGFDHPSAPLIVFFALTEQIANIGTLNSANAVITFPAEEVSFGRDITIDGLFVSMAGTAGQQVIFKVLDINGDTLLSTIFTLPSGANYETLQNYQIFDSTLGTAGTGQAPQLTIELVAQTGDAVSQLRIAKVAMFGSFDPMQRPV